MLIPCRKYVKLYYRVGQRDDVQVISRNEYYPVFICAKMEMKHDTAVDVAEELIARTCSPDWRWQLRRTIMPGDMFTVDNDIYAFVAPSTEQDDIRIFKLTKWEHLALAKPGQDTCAGLTSATQYSSQP